MRGQAVDPVVADAVTELLFLTPKNFLRQERVLLGVKRLAQNVLFEKRATFGILFIDVNHLVFWAHVHREVNHLLGQKRGANFDTPAHRCLVCTQNVPLVQSHSFTAALGVELLGVWRLVEVQVSPK